ncbi:hypothetical protein [Actinomadura sp. 3N407]|uniref:hypothetical protein n=1 Tax=Actinomadura sp. 3N407 TaxID=3457423 RepID=UPI003FCE0D47
MQRPVVRDQRGPAIRELAESGRETHHWRGRHAEVHDRVYLFETVIDRGAHWAIRHIEIEDAGGVLRYGWEHLEDEHGFLAEGEIEPEAWELERVTVQEFEAAWSSDGTAPTAT